MHTPVVKLHEYDLTDIFLDIIEVIVFVHCLYLLGMVENFRISDIMNVSFLVPD